ncbi:tRNA (adenosine(37)-N6)-dimethylallyltransferase MiaA, partial [Acidobacteriia bacterium AH_259_A11_L15]|nr:tRNA (adenosine(37)-N6)-dimethylallyltransferase MiaA [Acidobacteriia bacterium AH_259_A11_L15]
RAARAALAAVSGRGRLPIVTAGTGLYLRALLEGLSPLPLRSPALRARLREQAEERGCEHLHRLLARVDPESAQAIAPRDASKLIRALEVFF